jgi:putative lipoic acid-binding regulatory protein
MEVPGDHRPSEELLESAHAFPSVYRIKAIGADVDQFVDRVIAAVLMEVAGPSDIDYSVRSTASGRHAAVTLDINVSSANQVREIYARIREVEGLTMLL